MLYFRFGLFISMIVGYILFQTYPIRMQGVPSGHPFQEKMELAVPQITRKKLKDRITPQGNFFQ